MKVKELIDKHPKIFQDYEGNPGRINWLDLPDGWVTHVDHLCSAIQSYIDSTVYYKDGVEVRCPQVTCTQIKEKFGELRFYYIGGNDVIEGMVEMTAYLCSITCQKCGSMKQANKQVIYGWISIICENCK